MTDKEELLILINAYGEYKEDVGYYSEDRSFKENAQIHAGYAYGQIELLLEKICPKKIN